MRLIKSAIQVQLFALLALSLTTGMALAAVTGDCVNCHTMHNSQDGTSVASGSNGTTTAQVNLLKADCLGCHTNAAGSETIIMLGSGNQSRVPIVLTGSEPTYPPNGSTSSVLAGGNFYWVAEGDDTKGHNVFGLRGPTFAANVDGNLSAAPGNAQAVGTGSLCNDCHGTLATEASGCKGCHFAAHHVDNGNNAADGAVTRQGDGWYRFLSGAQMVTAASPATSTRDGLLNLPGVIGVEDANWEQNPASHNTYKGAQGFTTAGFGSVNGNSIGLYCTGCHSRFHHNTGTVTDGMQNTAGAWIRHPSDVVLPGAGTEYADYSYTALAPVAYETISAGGVGTTQLVTCISCHRPHGSPYPDMLRWDYGTCQTNTENADCGCFACHTTKDGVQ